MVDAAWQEGRIGVLVWSGFDEEGHYRDERVLIAAPDSGVEWSVRSSAPWFVTDNEHDSWGPVRWSFSKGIGLNGHYYTWHHVTLPCWLLSLSAGIWPLTSLTLLRRRRARLRLARAGCCAHCGYDLRATPQAGGKLLAQCPECGTPRAREAAV